MYYLKGAPEKVANQCKYWGSVAEERDLVDVDSNRVLERSREMGTRGLRGKALLLWLCDISLLYLVVRTRNCNKPS